MENYERRKLSRMRKGSVISQCKPQCLNLNSEKSVDHFNLLVKILRHLQKSFFTNEFFTDEYKAASYLDICNKINVGAQKNNRKVVIF